MTCKGKARDSRLECSDEKCSSEATVRRTVPDYYEKRFYNRLATKRGETGLFVRHKLRTCPAVV